MAVKNNKTKITRVKKTTVNPVVTPAAFQSSDRYVKLGASYANSNTIGMVIVGLVLFLAGFFLGKLWQENKNLKQNNQAAVAGVPAAEDTGPTAETLNTASAPTKTDNVRGASNPKVILVEYSDFECPYCNRYHPTTTKILEAYPDDVALVYRHYPLSFHAFAQQAAETAECVAKVGGNDAFWSYADYLFGQQEAGVAMSEALITESVQTAGVDAAQVKTCVDSGEMTQKIQDQEAEGLTAGVQGTPGTIVFTKDGAQELISGALPYEDVKAVVEKYL